MIPKLNILFLFFLYLIFNTGAEKVASDKWMSDSKTGIMIYYAPSSSAVCVFDAKNQLNGVFNGNTGTAILYSSLSGEAFYIAPGSSQETWYASKTKFEDYFPKMTSMQKIWQIGETEGLMFDAVSIDANISKELSEILVGLSKDYSNPFNAFAIYIQQSTTITSTLNNGLKGFAEITSKVEVDYQGNLYMLNRVFRGMGDFFSLVKGGLEALKENQVDINLENVVTTYSGSHIWMYFIEKMSAKMDIDYLAKTFNNLYIFFDIINKLGGDLEYGSSGFLILFQKL